MGLAPTESILGSFTRAPSQQVPSLWAKSSPPRLSVWPAKDTTVESFTDADNLRIWILSFALVAKGRSGDSSGTILPQHMAEFQDISIRVPD
ncbi:hypothetical protein FRC18_004210 [Serendipita sp. 400]|nr:hypothetical protein FRC18_004210 [Serendipita sp. 400]